MKIELDENTPVYISEVLRDENGNPIHEVIEVIDSKTFTIKLIEKSSINTNALREGDKK